MKNLEWLIELIKTLMKSGFTGKIEVNFFKGGIANANKLESIRPPQ